MYHQTGAFIDSKMAKAALVSFMVLLCTHCYVTIMAVNLRSENTTPWTEEFGSIELSCKIESIITEKPRIEWKKIKNGEPSYVYFEDEVSGDLTGRAKLMEPASLFITNATRTDTAQYRCEVTAHKDDKIFDEILINLTVRVKPVTPRCSVPTSVPVGKTAELRCEESEGYPKPQYQWFRNNDELPLDPKTSPRFYNSSYSLDSSTGTLRFSVVKKEDAGEYYCRAKNEAGNSQCGPQKMEVYDVNVTAIVLGVLVVAIVLLCITVGIGCACKKGYFAIQTQTGNNYKAPSKGDGVDYVRTEDEGDFRHKSSFVI